MVALMMRGVVAWLLGLAVLIAAGCRADTGDFVFESEYAVEDPQFERTLGSLLGPAILPGNNATTLVNGDEIFPAMLEAIRAANSTITMETFIYWSGQMGATFTDALADRARAGVKVHLLIDAVGSDGMSREDARELDEAGVKLVSYHGLKWYDIGSVPRIQYRTHRKLLVVDGRIGFTGGVGIADEWIGDAENEHHWRDTHYRVEGPVVAQFQAAFLDDWMESTGEVLHGSAYFPALEPAGEQKAQLFKSSARGGSESMRLMYLLSFAAARRSIRLGTPYFVPDDLTIQTLIKARERGVRVQMIVPGTEIDHEVVRKASRARWEDLLRAGVEIHEYQETMYHCKVMVVDELWASVGSSNLDPQSFELNAEANLNVLDAGFARRQAEIFDADLSRCERVTLEQWKARPLGEKMMENLASMLGPWL